MFARESSYCTSVGGIYNVHELVTIMRCSGSVHDVKTWSMSWLQQENVEGNRSVIIVGQGQLSNLLSLCMLLGIRCNLGLVRICSGLSCFSSNYVIG